MAQAHETNVGALRSLLEQRRRAGLQTGEAIWRRVDDGHAVTFQQRWLQSLDGEWSATRPFVPMTAIAARLRAAIELRLGIASELLGGAPSAAVTRIVAGMC